MDPEGAPRTAPEERVHRFMVEYESHWQQAGPVVQERPRRSDLFTLWSELMERKAHRHFLEPSGADLGTSFGSPPEYGSAVETLIGSEIDGCIARLQTKPASPVRTIHEHTLQQRDGDWPMSWFGIAHEGDEAIGVTGFGASAPAAEIAAEHGVTVEGVLGVAGHDVVVTKRG